MGLQASTNNRPSTVLSMFLTAVKKYGMPSRLRGDRGWENKLVSILMIIKRGRNRGSFLWGSSTRNTRIERLWLEVGTQFARAWRAFFSRLEDLHSLDRTNPHHMWLLHLLFLDSINYDCNQFQQQWNAHPISRVGHNHSPQVNGSNFIPFISMLHQLNGFVQDMFFLSQLEHGMYEDCRGVHPDLLNQFYGVKGKQVQRQPHQSGAGHPADEEEEDLNDEWHGITREIDVYEPWYGVGGSALEFEEEEEEEWHGITGEIDVYEPWYGVGGSTLEFEEEEEEEEWHGVYGDEDWDELGVEDLPDYVTLVNFVGEEDEGQFNQQAINTPKHANPFLDEGLHAVFRQSLARLQNTGVIPVGYGAHPNEWGATGYPSFGVIQTGLSGRKELRITLPDSIWRPRSVQWVQGLYLMNQLLDTQND